jgi:hypothetical protein
MGCGGSARVGPAEPTPEPSAYAQSLTKVDIPIQRAGSEDGILSYFRKKYGGNVHDLGIITITSKSADRDPEYGVKNVADEGIFISQKEPDQWVCWDFGEMRVCPTHYTIRAGYLKSWVFEGSVDGESWTEIDRKTNNRDFKSWNSAPFTVSTPAECRFIRLTQTDKNRNGDHILWLSRVEFFGILYESSDVKVVVRCDPSAQVGPAEPTPEPSAYAQSLTKVDIPIQGAGSPYGIISYFRNKYGGHVHDMGIIGRSPNG